MQMTLQIKDRKENIKTPIRHTSYQREKRILATYDYTDEDGNLLFQNVRYEPKDFRQRRPDGKGGWIWDLGETQLALYKLPEILELQFVYLCEDEKDVETLRKNDMPATCSPFGLSKWRNEYNESLCNKTVIILLGNDKTGSKNAEKVANSLYAIVKKIKIVNLPNLTENGDVAEYFENGQTIDELINLETRIDYWKPLKHRAKPQSTSKLFFTTLTELLKEPEEETSFVWENTLPSGGFSICSAKPKVGKSTLARNLAIKIVKGEPFLNRPTNKGKILYLCLEEKRSEVKNHFEKMGVKSDNILIHTGAMPENVIEGLAFAIAEFEPVLVIIDPLSRVLRVRDFNDYGSMARAFEPLIDLARKTNCHILALHHDSKVKRNGGDALLGSTAIFGAVDSHIQLKKRDKGRTILTTQRYGEDMPETVIELEKETGIITAQGELKFVVLGQVKDEILKISNDDKERNEQQIKERIEGFSQGEISKALRELVDEEKLYREGKGKKGNPFLYSRKVL
jgi:hypothetical protein